jgi:hypothetical protein
MRADDALYSLDNAILSKLTLSQLEALPSVIPTIKNNEHYYFHLLTRGFGYELKQNFPKQNNQMSNEELVQKLEFVCYGMKHVSSLNKEVLRMPVCLLTLEALSIQTMLRVPDHELLIQYLSDPLTGNNILSQGYRSQLSGRRHPSREVSWSDEFRLFCEPKS